MGTKPMTYEEAARILDPETNLEALAPYAGDCEARQAVIVEACRMGARALRALPSSGPLTAEQLREMDGEPAWWDDGEGSCWGIISVDSRGMWGGIPFFRGRWREVNFEYNIEERKMKIYRRPPEGEA